MCDALVWHLSHLFLTLIWSSILFSNLNRACSAYSMFVTWGQHATRPAHIWPTIRRKDLLYKLGLCKANIAKSFLLRDHTDRMLGSRILLMPPSLTLIFRHKLEMVCGDVLLTFLDWTHCVAMPNIMSPTRFTSAKINHITLCPFGKKNNTFKWKQNKARDSKILTWKYEPEKDCT